MPRKKKSDPIDIKASVVDTDEDEMLTADDDEAIDLNADDEIGGEDLPSLVRQVISTMNEHCIAQKEQVHVAVVAVLAGEHVFLVGPPGVNKTRLVRLFTKLVGMEGNDLFCATLDNSMVPDAILGHISIQGLKEDKYRRVTTGKLPEARIACIGEVLRGNGALRYSLHTALCERYIENDGKRQLIPLQTAFCDSNDFPHRVEDEAFWDRFLFHMTVGNIPVDEEDAFIAMLATSDEPELDVILSMDDFAKACRAARAIPVPQKVRAALYQIRTKLTAVEIILTDRRWGRCQNALQAVAWLNGDQEVGLEHFPILRHVLWDNPEHIEKMEKIIAGYSGSAIADGDESIIKDAERILADVNASPDNDGKRASALVSLSKMVSRATSDSVKDQLNDIITEMEKYMLENTI